MEVRKVQLTGGSSSVITLPKEWIEAHKVKKNDPLGIYSLPDGTLLVTTDIRGTQVARTKTVDLSDISDSVYLFRVLIGLYIAGYTTITLVGKGFIPAPVRSVVREFTQMTIGPEVMEETEETVVLKDLLNPLEMPFDNTIRRMYVVSRDMHRDAIGVLMGDGGILVDEVCSRDRDVDRLHWLVCRQVNMVFKDPALARKMAVEPRMVFNAYSIARIIERIGDHAVRIAENAEKVRREEVSPAIMSGIVSASRTALSIFSRSITSYFDRDIGGSHRNIEAVAGLETACEEVAGMVMEEDTKTAVALTYVVESIRRTGEYAGDISENVINYLVEEQLT
jgi:phosphate uptake regulator